MGTWSLDIVRQGSFDLWTWVCIACSGVLLSYAFIGRLWTTLGEWLRLGLILIGIGGTLVLLLLPGLRTPLVGLVWTFLMMCIVAAVFYLRLEARLGKRRMGVLLAMRTLSLALLVPMLFEPVVRYIARPRPEKPLVFLIDTSGSMSFPDQQNGPTRLQSVWQALRPTLPGINSHFVPKYYTFSTDVQELKDPNEMPKLQAEGRSTDLVNAVAKVLGQSTRDDTELVLISDGIDNTSSNVADILRASKRPIHTIRVGSEQASPTTLANIAVDNIEAPDDFTVNHESTIKALIRSSALANRVVDVQLATIDEQGRSIGVPISRKLVLQPTAEGQTVDLPFKPTKTGVQRLAIWVDPVPGERSTIDNRQEFQGLAIDPRIKVLYVEGRARPEYREVNRALARDTNIELASLLRIQADRFAASGVIDGEPFRQMPRSADEWKRFDVLILGDLDSSFLGAVQQSTIEQVCSSGAGLLMIGGQNSFGPGGYAGSPIERALPVFVGNKDAGQEKAEFVPRLTSDGAAHPAMEGLSDWFGVDSRPPTKTLPPLRGNVVVPKPKSGAQVLLRHSGHKGPDGLDEIVLATQLYGQGRSAAFTVDTTYLWYLPLRGMGQDSPYNRLWGQMIRWLAGQDVRNRQRGAGVEALLNKTLYQLGESVRVRAVVRDEKGDATRFAQVGLQLKHANDPKVQTLALNPSEARTGMFELVIPTPPKGDFTAEIVAAKDGKELGRQTLKFTVIPPADEMLKLAANPQLLTTIATETRGYNFELGEFPRLIDELIRSDPNTLKSRQESVPLNNLIRAGASLTGTVPAWNKKYDLPTQGLLVLALLTTEWILRRRWQLP